MDRSRSPPAAPCRYRPRPPAALRRPQRAAQESPTLRPERLSSTMTCETTGEENALSDSGPLRPASDEEVLACDIRVSSVSRAVGYGGCKPIPACASGTEAVRLNRGRNRSNVGDT